MFFDSATTPSGKAVSSMPEGSPGLAWRLYQASHFLSDMRLKLRFGDLTRAPLRLIRFQMIEEMAECEWIARLPDPWDADLERSIGQRHSSLQAVQDAIEIRRLIFRTIPQVSSLSLRAYRTAEDGIEDLIITGACERRDSAARSVRSLAMRAQLLGFRFAMEDGILKPLYPGAKRRVGA